MDGAVRLAINHAQELAKRNHRIYFVGTLKENLIPTKFKINGAKVYAVRSPIIPSRIRSLISPIMRTIFLSRRINRLVKKYKIDIIYAIGFIPMLSSLNSRFSTKIPIVVSYQGSEDSYFYNQFGNRLGLRSLHNSKSSQLSKSVIRNAGNYIFSWMNALIFPSQTAYDAFNENFKPRSRTTESIIPNGVDCRFFSPEKEFSEYPLILYVGVLSRRKGLDLIIKAAPLVLKNNPTAKFVFIGKGGFRSSLERLAVELGVNNSVSFLGAVEDDVLLSYYRKATTVVVPTYFDTFPTAVLEAMAMEKPIITTSNSSTAEVFSDLDKSLIIRPGDYFQLADSIIKILNDRNLQIKIGGSTRSVVESKYSLKSAVDKLENLITKIVN
jgi:glycosyltransferase involved in cell wall biosynthesis